MRSPDAKPRVDRHTTRVVVLLNGCKLLQSGSHEVKTVYGEMLKLAESDVTLQE